MTIEFAISSCKVNVVFGRFLLLSCLVSFWFVLFFLNVWYILIECRFILYQNTALHLAAQEGRTNAVSFLLDSDADLELNNDGEMAMDFAIVNVNKEVAMAMVSNDR